MSTHIPKGMPRPTDAGAPSFTGAETLDLLEFFNLFDDLADACGLTDAEKCTMVVRYVDKTVKRFWITLEGYETHDYAILKKSVLHYYPGAAEGRRYTCHDLASIVTAARNDAISTEAELLEYYRRFRPPAVWLVANEKISKYERDRSFLKGLPETLQHAIVCRLWVIRTDFSRSEFPKFEDVLYAGRLVLLDADPDVLLTEPLHDSATAVTGRRNVHRPTRATQGAVEGTTRRDGAPRDVRINGVSHNLCMLSRAQMDEVEVLAREMHEHGISEPTYSALFTRLACLAPAAAQAWLPPSSNQFHYSSL